MYLDMLIYSIYYIYFKINNIEILELINDNFFNKQGKIITSYSNINSITSHIEFEDNKKINYYLVIFDRINLHKLINYFNNYNLKNIKLN